jgi:hypothetical protein
MSSVEDRIASDALTAKRVSGAGLIGDIFNAQSGDRERNYDRVTPLFFALRSTTRPGDDKDGLVTRTGPRGAHARRAIRERRRDPSWRQIGLSGSFSLHDERSGQPRPRAGRAARP